MILEANGKAPRKAAIMFILLTVLLDVLALGMIIPILPKLVISMVDGDASKAARVFGVFGFSWALMQFLSSPVLGALSDRFGRRPIILFSNFALGLNYIFAALAPDLISLFITRLVSGVAAASISTASAYISDVTPGEERAEAFGKLGMVFSLGFIAGPAVSALVGAYDPRLPFWVAACFSLANGIYGYFVLPESLSLENRAGFRWRAANALGALRFLAARPGLPLLAVLFFLNSLAHEVLPATFVLYTDYRYHWDLMQTAMTFCVVGVFGAGVQGVLIKPVIALWGERASLVVGLTCGAMGFFLYGIAWTGAWFWSAIPVAALWGLATPSIQAMMTRRVGPDEQGQLQGAISALRSIGGLIGPFLFTGIFAWFISNQASIQIPGAGFYLSALLLSASLSLALWNMGRIMGQK